MDTFNGFSNQFGTECNVELRSIIGVIFTTNTLTGDSVVVTESCDAFTKLAVVQDQF